MKVEDRGGIYGPFRDGVGLGIRLIVGIGRIGVDGGFVSKAGLQKVQFNRYFAGIFTGNAADIPYVMLPSVLVDEVIHAGVAAEPA